MSEIRQRTVPCLRDFARRRSGVGPSDFYNMERTQVNGYANYKKVFTRQGIFGGIFGEW